MVVSYVHILSCSCSANLGLHGSVINSVIPLIKNFDITMRVVPVRHLTPRC